MRFTSLRSPWLACVLSLAIAAPPGALAGAQTQPAPTNPPKTAVPAKTAPAKTAAPAKAVVPPVGTNADTGWPRTIALKSGTAIWYQPQIESWVDQKNIVAWSAVAYQPTGAKEPALGTIKIEGPTSVSVDERVVRHGPADHRVQLQVAVARSGQGARRRRAGAAAERAGDRPRSRARVRDRTARCRSKNVEGIKADPPKVFSAPAPAILINLDGDPIWSPIEGLDLRYALNTNWDLFEHTPSKTFYLRYNESWLQASAVTGPWSPVKGKLPGELLQAAGRRQLEGRQGRRAGQEALGQGGAEGLRQHDAGRADRAPGRGELPEGRGRADAARGSTTRKPTCSGWASDGDFYFLVAGRWFKAPQPRWAVDVCDADAAGRLQADSRRASAVARAGLGAGHAAGDRSRAARDRFREPRASTRKS